MMQLSVACALIGLGLYGVLTRRDIIAVLASLEVLVGGALVLLVTLGASSVQRDSVHAAALLLLVLIACEAAVGLALLVAVARRTGKTAIDDITEVRG
jgi:NADH-quinone oxidoreductase subunit K